MVLRCDADDSGFVGWLASRIKAATGSGLFVVCGQNQETASLRSPRGRRRRTAGGSGAPSIRWFTRRIRDARRAHGAERTDRSGHGLLLRPRRTAPERPVR
ncbi:DUF6196 family protein [Pseudonocardia zijingensis]|uniref:DUF6196 family protein n=1 Tax=Pseudonocardia zijingensis TaxID=153376 RepID=UPI00361D97B7